jgi:hypothetical protein
MTMSIELRLIDTPAPAGEITVKDLVGITVAMQELIRRISREAVKTPGPGRAKQFVEEFSQLRVRGIHPGSTVLEFAKGAVGKLDFDRPEERIADNQFWELVTAISQDRRPKWVTDLIAESAKSFVEALQSATPVAVIGGSDRHAITIDTARIHVGTWTSNRTLAQAQQTAAGRLEKVDLRSHTFRVRDDVGHAVDLRHVDDDVNAAQLVGQWVIARGRAVLHRDGRLVALNEVTVERATDPAAAYISRTVKSADEILASAPGPEFEGGIELTDEEFAAFLEAARP